MASEGDARPPAVVGVDGSDQSVAALRWAVRYGAATGTPVRAVLAWHYPTAAGQPPVGHAPEPVTEEVEGHEVTILREAIAKAGADGAGADVHGEVRYGHPVEVLIEESGRDHVRTARAKGVPDAVLMRRHVLQNALIPILTDIVVAIPFLFMGSLLLESFFGIPGLGSMTVDAIHGNDFATLRTVVYIGALLFVLGQILTDVGFDQHLGDTVPLDAVFRDESGRTVKLGDYFGKRPVVLSLAYYECPMLCTVTLNGLASALDVLSFDPGRDFEIVNVSFEPKETPALAAAKKAAYLHRYKRPARPYLPEDSEADASLREWLERAKWGRGPEG